MTYQSRGRSIAEAILAVIVVGFLTGFVAVLCIGNYFRAKKAMERQRQRRLARLSGNGAGRMGGESIASGSPAHSSSAGSSSVTNERQHLLATKPPELPRRRNNNISNNQNEDLIIFSSNEQQDEQQRDREMKIVQV